MPLGMLQLGCLFNWKTWILDFYDIILTLYRKTDREQPNKETHEETLWLDPQITTIYHVLFNNLKFCVIYWGKHTFSSSNWSFILNYFKSGHSTSKSHLLTRWPNPMTTSNDHIQLTVRSDLSLVLSLPSKNLRHCFVPEVLMIKESCNLTGPEHILMNKLKL